jgi:hypothetical protein
MIDESESKPTQNRPGEKEAYDNAQVGPFVEVDIIVVKDRSSSLSQGGLWDIFKMVNHKAAPRVLEKIDPSQPAEVDRNGRNSNKKAREKQHDGEDGWTTAFAVSIVKQRAEIE